MKTTALPQVIGNFLTCPGWDSNLSSGERQLQLLLVSGSALIDQTAIRVGPSSTVRLYHEYKVNSKPCQSNQ